MTIVGLVVVVAVVHATLTAIAGGPEVERTLAVAAIGDTQGDTVVWLPGEKTLLSGDLVEFDATPYAGDAYFSDWPQTLPEARDTVLDPRVTAL